MHENTHDHHFSRSSNVFIWARDRESRLCSLDSCFPVSSLTKGPFEKRQRPLLIICSELSSVKKFFWVHCSFKVSMFRLGCRPGGQHVTNRMLSEALATNLLIQSWFYFVSNTWAVCKGASRVWRSQQARLHILVCLNFKFKIAKPVFCLIIWLYVICWSLGRSSVDFWFSNSK